MVPGKFKGEKFPRTELDPWCQIIWPKEPRIVYPNAASALMGFSIEEMVLGTREPAGSNPLGPFGASDFCWMDQ